MFAENNVFFPYPREAVYIFSIKINHQNIMSRGAQTAQKEYIENTEYTYIYIGFTAGSCKSLMTETSKYH